MSEIKHTPGPWKAEFDNYGEELWFGGKGCGTWSVGPAYLGGKGKTSDGRARMEADARLISAAPDLLEALKDARNKLTDQSEIDLVYIDEVIAKAEGRT